MAGRTRAPVALLGFDAGSSTLARRWAAEGHLPHFARIFAHGATATVTHEPGVMVGSVWPTTLSGVGVARHGFYTGIRPAPFSYDYVPEAPLVEPFWADVARSGRRVWAADAPFFAAVEGLDGVQVVEWGCHDRYFGPHSEPPEALDDLVAVVGRHPIGMLDHPDGYERFAPCDWVHLSDGLRTAADTDAFLTDLHAAIDSRAALVRHRGDLGPFDLIVDVVAETHCAGHHLWSLHDPDHVDHDPEHLARLDGDPLLGVYRRMDDILGEHLRAIGPDALSYVLLSHGMSAHHDGTHLLDEVLWRLDQAYRGEPTPWVGPTTTRVQEALARVPVRARRPLLGAAGPLIRRRLGATTTPPPDLPPPGRRLWYQLENNTVSGAVRFNQVGREPQGLLSGPMVQHATRWLQRELSLIVNLDHGGPVVDSVHPSDAHFDRRADDGLPDLFVEWDRRHPIERVWSPTIGLISRPYVGLRTGDHEGVGEVVVTGPGIRPGRIGEIRPTDIAPTVAAATGVYLGDRDGEPVGALLPEPTGRATEHRSLVDLRSATRTAASPDPDGADIRHELIELRRSMHALQSAHHVTRQRADAAAESAATLSDVLATTRWIRDAEVPDDLLVSVVMPTRGRREHLALAVRSVLTQSHSNLELVVVDDATDDGTASWLAGLEDPRLVVIHHRERRGEGASRNSALEVVRGDVVAFLDDDNTFDRDWLRSLAWLFGSDPQAEVAYGARVVDDVDRHHGREGRGLPWLQLNAWDRATMRDRCLVDMNTVAHRRGDVRFDPELVVFTDWDYLMGLTRTVDPVRLPVVAAHYRTDAPDRASVVPPEVERSMYDRVHARWSDAT